MSHILARELSVDPTQRHPVGLTDLSVTTLGLGTAPIGGLFTPVDADPARDAVDAAMQAGIRYVDVAPFYGLGMAEERVGEVLRGYPRASYTLSTKVGRLIVDGTDGDSPESGYFGHQGRQAVFDYSRDGVLRSLEESMLRLGVDHIDIAYIHDPDDHYADAANEAYPALAQLKSQGVIGAVGVGMNRAGLLARFVAECDLDVILCAGRYSLLDRSAADVLFPLCLARDVSLVIGGVFNSGVLADPYAADVFFDYAPAAPSIVRRAQRFAEICASHDTPLRAAALQFPLRHEAVTSVLTGVRSRAEFNDNLGMMCTPIASALWDALDTETLQDGR